MRTCICCRNEFLKTQLVRVVRTPEGEFAVDKTGKANGRGAYVCKSAECIKKLKKSKALDRTFKTPVPSEVYALLEETVVGEEK